MENLSLIIPPSIEDVNPRIDKAAALNNEYSFLKFGKFFKKKSGKYTDSDIPLKALRADPIVTHLAVFLISLFVLGGNCINNYRT